MRRLRGSTRSMCLRLCSAAPLMTMESTDMPVLGAFPADRARFQVLQSSTKDDGKDAVPPSRLDNLLGLRTVPGAFIMDITSGGPAERAGFNVCDLIAGFNGRPLRQYGELQAFVSALREAAASS